ncbi:MAG: BMP family protein [Dermatophilaceae bacterium]|nr:BMP family ABC transporter substrate-binding protein [Intrasporangiaceae bacterium]
MRQTTKYAAVFAAAALALSACGSDSSDGADATGTADGTETAAEQESDVRVGMAYDVGGRGDQSFNDAAAAGLDQAAAEFGIETQEATATDGEPESAREERLQQLVDAGYTTIVAVGFAYAPSIAAVAPENPDVHFALIDSTDTTGDNVANLVFAEEQGSFLVGAAAALKTKTDNVGFVGGVQVPLIQKFEAGFIAGAKEINPDIEIQSTYLSQPPDFSGFGDPAKGKTAAEGMFQSGADVVYHAAGGSGGGVFTAAKQANKMAIGVDSDQAKTAAAEVQDVIITSMLKRVDVAVYEFLKAEVEGTFEAGEVIFDLSEGGVDYSTTGGKVDDIKDQLDALKQQIIDGEITVPTTP